MSATATRTDTRITIDRWLNRYRVADGPSSRQAAIHEILQRIDRCVAQELPASCERWLDDRFDQASPAVWRIRELHLSFTVDVSAPDAGEIASAWSERVAPLIAEVIARGEESEDVLCFPTRAAYLAQFALDFVAGRASNKWYYDEFRWLGVFPTGTALVELLTREPGQGTLTLVHLAELGRLDEILLAMTEANAAAIHQQCFGPPSDSVPTLALWSGRLLEVWNDEPLRFAGDAEKSFRDALRLLARAAVRFPGLQTDGLEIEPSACAALEGLFELRRVLQKIRSAVVADRLVRDLVEGKSTLEEAIAAVSRLGVVSPESALRFLLTTAQGDSDWAMQAAAVLSRDQLPPAQAVLAAEALITGFGGVFLLGPALVRWNEVLEEAVGQIEQPQEILSFLRYITIIKCLGSPRTLEAMGDTALRFLTGCHRSHLEDGREACPSLDIAQVLLHPSLAELADSPALLPREREYFSFATLWPHFDPTLDLLGVLLARDVMQQFARRLIGFQTSSPEHLCRNFFAGVGTVRNGPERVEVELPRSPLSLVLQLSGLARQTYAVPWLEGKEVCLLPSKE